MLEQVAEDDRKKYRQGLGKSSQKILAAGPVAWWRMDDMAGPLARDSSGNGRVAMFEPGVVFFLAGPGDAGICQPNEVNRAAHFAGGRMVAPSTVDTAQYSVAMWIWNGMPDGAREMSGWFFSRGRSAGKKLGGEHLGVGGAGSRQGRLIFQAAGTSATSTGSTQLQRWAWNHVVVVRDGGSVRIHLNGSSQPEIQVASSSIPDAQFDWFFGGRSDSVDNWEGRIDEIAVFDRALLPSEVADLFATD